MDKTDSSTKNLSYTSGFVQDELIASDAPTVDKTNPPTKKNESAPSTEVVEDNLVTSDPPSNI